MSPKASKRKRSEQLEESSPVEDAEEAPPVEDQEELNWSDEEGTTVDGIYIPPPIKTNIVKQTTTRLIISKITNNFFKSYAEETVLGPFSKCFNGIVGPNGSGKSNVIDSMLFVFGYRANKIRCKKLSVLLHNSESYKKVQSCTVAVHFCEIIDKANDEYEIVPGSEFVVSRTANKDNSSYYELSGKRVQFKEIAKLLRHHGIDLDHNRFLILQGEVEEIAMMKCKGANENETGMLEYLEDIIGTTRYKKPLSLLDERIEHLSVIRSEKLNRISLIKKELDRLEGPMQEAMNFLKTENKISALKNLSCQKHIQKVEENMKEVAEDNEKITESQNKIENKLKEIAAEKAEKEEIYKENSSKYANLQKRKDKMKEAFNMADKKDTQLQAEMVQINKNRKKYKQQVEEEKRKLLKLECIPEENAKKIKEYEQREEKLSAEKESLEEEKSKVLASIYKETNHLQVEKDKLEIDFGHLKKTVDSTKSAYDIATSELKLSQSEEESSKIKLSELQENLEKCKNIIKQRSEQVGQLKKKIPPTEESLLKAQSEYEMIKSEKSNLAKQLNSKRTQLEETRSSMQMSKSRGRVLDALLQQKREGKCPGVYGRLGDLGGIDQKYDVAISTACGALDHIVVDNAQTGNWCIEFLKTHGLGRASFIALDKQEYLREYTNRGMKTPENVHRLFDLIKVQDEAVKTAFYFGLRDTLVADNLEQASRIAYGATRHRVVTLKGDLIETSGTMSGGGRTVLRGRMGQSALASTVNPKEVEKMEQKLEEIEEKNRELVTKERNLENQLNVLQPELTQMKANYEIFTRELQSSKEQQPILNQQIIQQESVVKSMKSDAKQIQKLTVIVESKKAAYDKALAATEKIQIEINELTSVIEEKTTGKMKIIQKKITEVTKNFNNIKSEITRLTVAITTSERDVKKCNQKIKNLEQNIEDSESKLLEMKKERDEIEEDGQKLLKCIEELTQQLENDVGQFDSLKEEVNALTAEEKKLILKKVEIDQMAKTIREKLGDCKTEIHQWKAKIAQLKLHEICEDGTELRILSAEELQEKNLEVIELELEAAKNSIKNIKPNLNVIQEYKTGQKVYAEKSDELEGITTKRHDMKALFDKVKNQRRDEFMMGYNIIRLKLKEMYQMITLGGDADFEIIDSCDPFADGVQLNVRPPRKSWKAISNLSGGEKTLSSLALVFALHYYKPSPLYVMDEIDAALDFKNVSIIGHYIKERTKNAQFIIISLRSNMFELCDNLIGIYKTFNCTKSITVDPTDFEN